MKVSSLPIGAKQHHQIQGEKYAYCCHHGVEHRQRDVEQTSMLSVISTNKLILTDIEKVVKENTSIDGWNSWRI